jgi:transposase
MTKKTKEAATARGRPRRTTAGCPKGGFQDKQASHDRAAQASKPRLRTANRQQLLSPKTIDQLLETDHPARAVWRYVEDLDLSLLYDRIGSREGFSGRPAIDPRVLVALWLYAYLAGISSARLLARLCRRDDVFRWLAGGLVINYHTLADFRVDDVDFLEQLFQHSVEVLRQQGLVDLERVAQDGIRIRASAGAASFRRRQTLERLLQEAKAKLAGLEQQLADKGAAGSQETARQPDERPRCPPQGRNGTSKATNATTDSIAQQGFASEGTGPKQREGVGREATAGQQQPTTSKAKRAARLRHARQRVARIEQALLRLPELEARKAPGEEHKARVSTTDPEATVMKMADGGYRPAYNLQLSTTCDNQVVVGVAVDTSGSDRGQLPPMLDQIEKRFGQRPQEALVDGGYVDYEEITKVQQGKKGCKVYAPVPASRKEGVDCYAPKSKDSPQVAEWRQRMGTAEAKEIYKQRGATAEWVNAQARNHGLQQLLIRGKNKVIAIGLWLATALNMVRGFFLQFQPVGSSALSPSGP